LIGSIHNFLDFFPVANLNYAGFFSKAMTPAWSDPLEKEAWSSGLGEWGGFSTVPPHANGE